MEQQLDGSRAFAATGGGEFAPGRPTVVFVHGAGLDHTVWALQTRYFANRGYNALAVDLPGHGRSEGPVLGSIGAMADWLNGFLDPLKRGPTALIGHSMGALVALDCAARYADAVQSLALLGVCVPMQVGKPLLEAARDDVPAAIAMMIAWSHSKGAQLGGNPTPGLWMTGAATRLLADAGDGVLFAGLSACHAYGDGISRATQIAGPALVVSGGLDRMTPPRQAEALIEALPDRQNVVIGECGHMMMAEQPDKVLDYLAEFVAASLK